MTKKEVTCREGMDKGGRLSFSIALQLHDSYIFLVALCLTMLRIDDNCLLSLLVHKSAPTGHIYATDYN